MCAGAMIRMVEGSQEHRRGASLSRGLRVRVHSGPRTDIEEAGAPRTCHHGQGGVAEWRRLWRTGAS